MDCPWWPGDHDAVHLQSQTIPQKLDLVNAPSGCWVTMSTRHGADWQMIGNDSIVPPFSCDQAVYEWFSPSVCLSARPSVCHTFSLFSHHCIIMKFSGVISIDRSDVLAKGQGQRSEVNVTKVKTQFGRFWTVTPFKIHIWWWNGAQN